MLDAMDAIITAGRAAPGIDIEERVLRELAKMLGGYVLLHYAHEKYVTLRSQEEHTLSTWTVRKLVADRRLVARRVRPRPEFWRPEQRRPGGVLSVPIGEGIACIARRRPFSRKEVRAVRTVLRFLDARRAGQAVPAIIRREGDLVRAATPLAGEGLIGQSRAWKHVIDQVWKVARSRCSVVLLGETGTGKERVARALHSASTRSQGPFVPINCGAVPRDILHSELFGHVRGAFTGAERNHDGVFVRAHRGTLFLDEVGDMPQEMQVALLRAIEEHCITPVGTSRPREVDVRVVAATNRDFEADVRRGRFREDLFHRLSVVQIYLPPLRERIEDLPLLAVHLLGRMPENRSLHVDSLAVLARYSWPGNVRELDNVLRAAALLVDGPEVTPEILDGILESRRQTQAADPAALPPRTSALLGAMGERWLSAPDLATTLHLSARTVNRELARLLEQGLVRGVGQARARRYHRARWRDVSGLGSHLPIPS